MTAGSYLPSGSVFGGRFEIGRELGRGGVSVVYAARDRHVGQDVALKLLVPSPAAAHQARERMRREVHAVRGLVHPNIVAVHDFVEDGPYGAVIMELVDGEDLDRRVRRVGAMPADDVARIGADVAAALAAAHRHGVLHRDVKPQNILLERDGRARLADFGSARMEGETTITRTGAIVGTLAYMAPETIAGRRGDARADVFALGMTLFHAAAGRLPDRPSPHLPVPPSEMGYTPLALRGDVPTWLAHVIARATSADPGDRYPTPTALADALGRRDAHSREGRLSFSRSSCVLCGGVDVLGDGVCPSCATDRRSRDGLVCLERPETAAERDSALEAVAALLGADVPADALAALATGTRPLARVPLETERRIVDRLAARNLRVRVIPEAEAWRALPLGFRLTASAVVALGVAAGVLGDPLLGIAAVPFGLLLVVAATMSLRRPVLTGDRRTAPLSDRVRVRVAATFMALPSGTARALLADVVRRGQAVQRTLTLRGDTSGTSVTVDALIETACESARDLAALDESLARFDRERARETSDGPWLDSLVDCERTRDAGVQRLLDAITVLGQLEAQSIRGAEDAAARLGELVAELASDVRARSVARDELQALLEQ